MMKKTVFFFLMIAALSTSFYSCKTNTDDLWDSIHQLDGRVTSLEELCKQMNGNIGALQTLLQALQSNVSITKVNPVTEGGKTVGYTISFSKGDPITIYHGEKGDKGDTGIAGKDGVTPVVGVRRDTDNVYYWTLNGEWLIDDAGNKVKAVGENGKDGENGIDGKPGMDGITPQLKIENGRWWLSMNNGSTWSNIGQATGDTGKDGVDGDDMFSDIDYTSSQDFVTFTLSNGTVIKLPTWYAFGELQSLCEQMNTDISSIQSIIEALQQKDGITNVVPLNDNGKVIGYKLYFEKREPITIYHGKDGADGNDGQDGSDGKDGVTPVVGVKQDTDGIYYWTLNSDWMKDDNGNKIKAQGVDGSDGQDGTDGTNGVTPQLKIEEDGYWYISYDNGSNWTKLGKATGADGTSGDAFFKNVTEDDDYVYLEMQAGNIISVPKHKKLSITFNETEDIRVLANQTYPIQYTITGATDKTALKALAQDGFRAVVKSLGNASGVIEVTTPGTILSSEVLVFVSDGEERTIMRSINFVEGVINITDRSYTVPYTGGTVSVQLSTNIDYTIEIPEADKTWISIAPTSRAIMRDETITFNVQQNNNTQLRYSIIKLVDKLGVTSETIQITQRGGSSQDIYVATAGTLEQQINSEDAKILEELKITGHLNTFDYEFLKTMPNLKTVDLSELSDTSIPASAFNNSLVSTVLLPLNLKTISDRAFYNSSITSIYIPQTVESIGQYAFANTLKLTGNIVIPSKTATIGERAFEYSAFNGTLILEEGVQSIGTAAFAGCSKVTGDLVIPNSVTSMKGSAFQSSTFTGSLSIGNALTDIPAYAFHGCSSFKGKITIGENVKSIDDHAFEGCAGLTGNLVIPNKVETIGIYAFYACIGFDGYLSIGNSMKSIGKCAFVGEEKIGKGTVPSTVGPDKEYARCSWTPIFNKVYCKAIESPTLGIENLFDGYKNVSVYIVFGTSHTVKYGGGPMYIPEPTMCNENYPQYLFIPINASGYGKNGWGGFEIKSEVEF